MKVEKVDIAELRPDEANARAHPEKNIETLCDSLKAFGQQKPIVVGEGNVVLAGNGLLAAAKQLGWKQVAIVRTKLKDEQARAYALVDNRSGELSEWDWESLGRELEALQEVGFDLATIGWQKHETDLILAAEFKAKSIEDIDEAADNESDGRLVVAFTPEQSEEVRAHMKRMGKQKADDAILTALRAWA